MSNQKCTGSIENIVTLVLEGDLAARLLTLLNSWDGPWENNLSHVRSELLRLGVNELPGHYGFKIVCS